MQIVFFICLVIACCCAGAGYDIGGYFLGTVMFVASLGSMYYLGSSILNFCNRSRNRENEIHGRRFLACLSAMLAKMAKADGVVSHDEIETVEEFLGVLGLEVEEQRYFKAVFRAAKDDANSVYDYASSFYMNSSHQQREILYEMLWDLAAADGRLDPGEDEILRTIPEHLHISAGAYSENKSKRMSGSGRGQGHSGGDGYSRGASSRAEDEFAHACHVLGASPSDTDGELKNAYRTMAKNWHPDRMKGLPNGAQKKANEKMAEINNAWEIIKRKRGIK